VLQFEEKTKVQVQDIDYVFEFGGGYGSMCRLFHNLGFRGRYIIIDLPPFSALQKYYLGTLGLPIRSVTDFERSKSGIVCVSDIHKLKSILADRIEARNTMFIATWSISETPISIRNSILPLTSGFQSFLLAYQDRFEEVNNVDFFNKWKETINEIAWQSWRIRHIPGNNYLVGRVAANS
jgi:hypothetical protein